MAGLRTSKVLQMKSMQRLCMRGFDQISDASDIDGLIRILVLDHEHETIERVQNALWVWPHKVAKAKSIDQAVEMCQHIKPTALFAAIDFSGGINESTITTFVKFPNRLVGVDDSRR